MGMGFLGVLYYFRAATPRTGTGNHNLHDVIWLLNRIKYDKILETYCFEILSINENNLLTKIFEYFEKGKWLTRQVCQ